MSEINDAAVEITIADELAFLDDAKETLVSSYSVGGVVTDEDVARDVRILEQIRSRTRGDVDGCMLGLIDDMRGVVEAFADIMRESGRADYAAELDHLVYRAEEFLPGAETAVKADDNQEA